MRAIARGSAARADEGDLEGELYHTISISICTVGGGRTTRATKNQNARASRSMDATGHARPGGYRGFGIGCVVVVRTARAFFRDPSIEVCPGYAPTC